MASSEVEMVLLSCVTYSRMRHCDVFDCWKPQYGYDIYNRSAIESQKQNLRQHIRNMRVKPEAP
eukprot:scaffold393499_cov23-Prasinocladus_malaysianus.AAC.1